MLNRKFNNLLESAVVILIMAIAVILGIVSLRPPAVVSAGAPLDEFSAERAMAHVNAIAEAPHPIGSLEHARVRGYLVTSLESLGLSPEIQKATVVQAKGPGWNVKTAIVHNVVVEIPGTGGGKAVALVAHYDTVPMTPGASDDTAPVAAILETARAVLTGPAMKNDLLLIFTDEEEYFQSGVRAFIDQHPWAGRIGLVLNFEAIGRSGPSIMFETGPESRWAVRGFARAAPYPVAQSWFFDVYRLTPINTDFTAFSEAGYPGLNFIYLAGGTVYHSQLDNPQNLDRRSLQHHGSNALSLVRHFGDKDLDGIRAMGGDAVYFSLLRGLLVNYPDFWAVPLALFVLLVLIWAARMGFRRKLLTVRGSLRGAAAFAASFMIVAGLTYGAWMLIVKLHASYRAMYFGRVYNSGLYLAAFLALSVAIAAVLHVLFRKRTSEADLVFGPLVLWWVFSILSSVFLPGFSYLFSWPLLFSLLAFIWIKKAEAGPWPGLLVSAAGSIPGILLFVPMVVVVFQFAPTSLLAITVLMAALLLGLLVPHIELFTKRHPWLLPVGLLTAAVGLLAVGSLSSDFDDEHPRPNAMAYLLNADSGEAVWFSPGETPDPWTAQFLPAEPELKTVGELFPLTRRDRRTVLIGAAPTTRLEAPFAEVIDDRIGDRKVGPARILRLRVASRRGAPIITLDIHPRAAVRAVEIAGQRIENPDRTEEGLWSLTCLAVPPEGIEVQLELEPEQTLKIQVTDQSPELPDLPGFAPSPRSVDMMPMPNFDYGTVVVSSKDYR